MCRYPHIDKIIRLAYCINFISNSQSPQDSGCEIAIVCCVLQMKYNDGHSQQKLIKYQLTCLSSCTTIHSTVLVVLCRRSCNEKHILYEISYTWENTLRFVCIATHTGIYIAYFDNMLKTKTWLDKGNVMYVGRQLRHTPMCAQLTAILFHNNLTKHII